MNVHDLILRLINLDQTVMFKQKVVQFQHQSLLIDEGQAIQSIAHQLLIAVSNMHLRNNSVSQFLKDV